MNLIVCVDKNWGIGNRGELLVSIPADKRNFKNITTGKVVVGGRKTMEGLPGGTTLAGRENIVITRQQGYSYGDAKVVHSIEESKKLLANYRDEDIFIIGGGEIYRAFLPLCNKAFVTKVDYSYEADTFFPNLDKDDAWVMTHDSEEQTYYDLEYYFTIYQRVKQ